MTGTFRIAGRFRAAPPAAEWREELAARLGARPRRAGIWAELALYGATACLADAQETMLPPEAQILVASHRGALSATRAVLEQGRDDLPLPLSFLQTQPSQMLAVLAAHLAWTGDASFICSRDPLDALRLAAAQAAPQGVLLGWVDETDPGATAWLRLLPATGAGGGRAQENDIFSLDAAYVRITGTGLEVLAR